MKERFSLAPEYRARTLFNIANALFFIAVTVAMVVPLWKVLVDSFNNQTSYGLALFPAKPSIDAYEMIFTQSSLLRPFLVSVYTTLAGTAVGLILCTTGAFVLKDRDLPGRKALSFFLLFTMIFEGGMVPSFLVMKDLRLLNTYWAVILPMAMNVYNLILMRNFFENIPESLYESAALDGCTPIMTFLRIVLPLSKAALASVGLFYGVALWSNYTQFAIYISDATKHNFQMRLRTLILDENALAAASSLGVSSKSVQNAAIIVAILPFAFLYPFLQKYFVTGVNMGAVKE
ncbi:MAG: carbohydrate ABC transporter permease [Oscillospiraceae bacterium]|jgi:putative aldouronate transport system permease protein|nr:carbohydrate ABC transporter permease [Oscillospiraceae bacterium]